MALFSPSESPAVTVKEVDLTGFAPNVQTTTGAFVGNFRWGPVDTPTLVSDEANLTEKFAAPDTNTTEDFHTATSFLTYSNSMYNIRVVDGSARNSFDSSGGASTAPTVNNNEDLENQLSTLSTAGHTFIGMFPGALGNSLKVEMCPADSTSGTLFSTWNHAGEFDTKPGTSDFASNLGAFNDEVHVVVVDEDGVLTGTAGNVLERYPYVSLAANAKNTDGSTNYVLDVINNNSRYVAAVGFDSDYDSTGAGDDAISGKNYRADGSTLGRFSASLTGGVDASSITTSNITSGYDLVQDQDTFQVDFLIANNFSAAGDNETIAEHCIAISEARKDCITVVSPNKAAVVNNSGSENTSVKTFADTLTRSSYAFMDNQHLKVFDKYNDKYIFVPACGATAGVMARSDKDTAPWYSPAGLNRGTYFNVVGLAYNPSKAERDELYKSGVNSITNLPGQGVTLFGDKTMLGRPSAFDRINVRRLFITLERAIGRAAQSVLFELNDEFTRAEFVNIVEPVLRDVKGRRGITDFRVVCDETNNTGAVIDRNELVASIFVKPSRSINYITLNFVATRTGVDFQEVVGQAF